MSRVHDMGGRFGDGPIPEKDDSEVFHTDWEARALALNLACGALGAWNIDASRHARECLTPKDYAGFTYYEKWLGGLTDILVDSDLLTMEDLDGPPAGPAHSPDPRALKPENVDRAMHAQGSYMRPEGPQAKFRVGDPVRTVPHAQNTLVKGGHTRLPAYAAGRNGTIERLHGNHVFPDSNAHFLGPAPQPLYAVRFTAHDLWGADAEASGDDMVLDLWQSYLLEPSA
ncbi:nitrile hydratase subunit beta [Falsihalocynthiibacter arcticus]|uniref:Nitrile hydratase subunit beta n=1 Tax=Falsihalocynthiibacter arcticus TaxID=1579316 RepID=A0A126V1X5_9RHOB|nr:nitrile hydratase subunit beta [Falsihalocynthiibacter arcticus]AML52280.1 nitrile hydratase subunit beta [Falsihalocynthiibacter arcticus]